MTADSSARLMDSLRAAVDTADPVLERAALAGIEARMFGGAAAPVPTVSRYRLRSRLGAGGMGVVYEAFDPDLDRRVAVKLLKAARRGAVGAAARRLVREARAIAKINDPHVIEVYDAGKVDAEAWGGDAHVYIVMELVEGVSLDAWLQHGPVGWRPIVAMFEQAARGLAAAHRAGLLHRDFKPQNVMVGDDGRVRVLDFGLVRSVAIERSGEGRTPALERPTFIADPTTLEASRSGAVDTNLTPGGGVIGTPLFLAPELLAGAPASVASDVYAFCVALYRGLYDRYPHHDETLLGLVRAKERKAPVFERRPEVPAAIVDLLRRGLSRDPARRPRTMDDVVSALHAALVRRPRWMLGAGVAVAGTLAAGALVGGAPSVPALCEDPGALIGRTWNPSRADRVASGLLDAGAAPEATQRVHDALNDYGRRWTTAARAACASPTRAAARRCLERRAAALTAAVGVLSGADVEVAKRGIDVVLNLPAPEDCDAMGVTTATGTEAIRTATATAGALQHAGQFAAALERASEAIALADGDANVAREAYLAAGLAQMRLSASTEAERLLRTAYFAAIETSDEEVATEAARAMAFLLVTDHGRLVEGERWLAYARASLERRGNPPRQTALVMLDEADAMAQRGDVDAAWAHAAEARRVAARAEGASERPQLLLRLVTFAILTERYEVALQLAEEATEQVARVYTRRHAIYASALHQTAYALGYLGRLEEAAAAYGDAIVTTRWLEGPHSLTVARSLNNRAVLLRRLGEPQRARADLEAAVVILDRNAAAPTHPLRVAVDTNRAEQRLEAGDYAGSLALHRDLLVRIEASVEPNVAATVAVIHRNMARAEAGLGQPDKARQRLELLRDEGLLDLLTPTTRQEVLIELAALGG